MERINIEHNKNENEDELTLIIESWEWLLVQKLEDADRIIKSMKRDAKSSGINDHRADKAINEACQRIFGKTCERLRDQQIDNLRGMKKGNYE